ncbi:MAG: transposase [Aphanocapsa sp. GSE-SYN-MK-11-07L]|nr:transposase [Aphanocapsa sp. GSE-SYN-MK-11-07L]
MPLTEDGHRTYSQGAGIRIDETLADCSKLFIVNAGVVVNLSIVLKQLEDQGELDLYYLDEVGFCLIPCIPYGWQLIGQTEEIESRRSQRLNVLGMMTRANQLHSYVSTQSMTSEVVIACIDAFFPSVNQRTVLVVDQASIHTSDTF